MRIFHRKKQLDIPKRRQGTSGDSGGVFQRNRTITGSSSDSIYATSTSGVQLQSSRTKAHSLRQTRRRVGVYIIGAFVGTAIFGTLLTQYIGAVRITSVDAGLSSDFDTSVYADAVQEYLGTRFFERFRFSINQDNLRQYIQTRYPEVLNIKRIEGDSVGSASVVISIRKPVASWLIGENTYYVDTDGEAFEKNYFNGTYVKIVDESGVSVTDGAVLASGRFLGFVGRIVSSIKEYGYTVTEARIPASTTRELDLRLDGVASVIRTSIDRPAGEQAEDMTSAIRYMASKGRSPSYIDVRISGRAFYQ